MVNLDDLKPGPSADVQSNALVEKYREKQDKSTALHQQVADIQQRGREGAARRDRGIGITEEKRAYWEALARADHEAHYGTAEIKSGYGPNASEPDAKDM